MLWRKTDRAEGSRPGRMPRARLTGLLGKQSCSRLTTDQFRAREVKATQSAASALRLCSSSNRACDFPLRPILFQSGFFAACRKRMRDAFMRQAPSPQRKP